MQNIREYHSENLRDYVGSLWQTEEFQQAHNNPDSPIYKCVSRVIKTSPVWFYDTSDPIQRTQFSSWWRHIQHRKYDIPAVTDLYYYHELTHIANHRHMDSEGFYMDSKWQNSVVEEELIASLESEVFVYWYFPSLRAKTFKFEIWADRFNVPTSEDFEKAKNEVCLARLRIFKTTNFSDPVEMSIYKYNLQNRVWCNYWNDVQIDINRSLQKLFSDFSQSDEISTAATIAFEKFITKNSKAGTPFYKQTKLFHEHTKATIVTSFTS